MQSTPSFPSTRVYIEGNIGCGKTCLIACLQNRGWLCTPEPLEKWDDVLQLFYQQPKTYAFHLQHCVMSSIAICNARVQQMNTEEKVLVFERSLQSSKLFTENCLRRGYITKYEQDLLATSIQAFERKHNSKRKDVFIYLRCPVQECARRILRRSRTSETNALSFLSSDTQQYLLELDTLHEEAFGSGSNGSNDTKTVHVVDASRSIGEVVDSVSSILAQL